MREEIPFFPPGTVVLTNRPDLLAVRWLTCRPARVVLSTEPLREARAGWFHAAELEVEAIDALLERTGLAVSHLRVVADLDCRSGVDSLHAAAGSPSLSALHDLTFLVLKHEFDRLAAGGSSIVGLFVDAVVNGGLHPFAGLFTGILKSTALELSQSVTLGVFTSETRLDARHRQAVAETAAEQYVPVVLYDGATRKTQFIDPAPCTVARGRGRTPPGPDSVVVAIGRGPRHHGRAAEGGRRAFPARRSICSAATPSIGIRRDMFEDSDEEFAKRRHAYMREQKAGESPASRWPRSTRNSSGWWTRGPRTQNITAMRRHCGAGRVHYLACDVLDRERLADARGGHDRGTDRSICSSTPPG